MPGTPPDPGHGPAATGHVVATAGHVDHGKSTLVHALTGIDPDRFTEEKERGLTIDLGFAWTTLPDGRTFAFVDVPGHVRFIRNMLAGVGTVQACLFVVAATEGWKPQSEEHLRILELVGVRHGVVALTKVDAADPDLVELARVDVAERTAGSFLAGAEVVEVAAPAGHGVDALRDALGRLLDRTPAAVDRGCPRLWVDRSFSARGAGTIVTGTLEGGRLAVDHQLVVVPGGRTVRVRGIERHGAPVTVGVPGSRVAVNLAGTGREQVERGDALVRAGQWHLTRRFDASLRVLDTLGHDVSRRGAYVAYLGSGQHPVRLRILGPDSLAPGSAGLARLHLDVDLPLVPGDRYVLREWGRAETVGGGEVLDVDPVVPAARARPDRSVERVVAERGWVRADDLERLTGDRRAPSVGPWVVDPPVLESARADLAGRVAAAGPLGLDVAALDDRERALLEALDGVLVEAGRARPATTGPDRLAEHPYRAALAAAPFTPPPPDGVDRAALRALVQRGLVVERDGVWFSPAAVDAAAERLADLLAERPEGVTVSAVREALGSTRKYVLPLLAELDARGVTRRRGDVRVAGPRLGPPPRSGG